MESLIGTDVYLAEHEYRCSEGEVADLPLEIDSHKRRPSRRILDIAHALLADKDYLVREPHGED